MYAGWAEGWVVVRLFERMLWAYMICFEKASKQGGLDFERNDALHSKHPSLHAVQRCDLESPVAHYTK